MVESWAGLLEPTLVASLTNIPHRLWGVQRHCIRMLCKATPVSVQGNRKESRFPFDTNTLKFPRLVELSRSGTPTFLASCLPGK